MARPPLMYLHDTSKRKKLKAPGKNAALLINRVSYLTPGVGEPPGPVYRALKKKTL